MRAKLKQSGVLGLARPGFDVEKILMFKGDALSIKLIGAVWDLQVGSSTDKLVLLALADYSSEEGRCWPSVAALVARTELSERAVRKALKNLQAAGRIEVIHRHRHSNMFRVHQVPVRPTLAAPGAGTPLRQMPLMGALRAARTVIDPSLRTSERSKSGSAEDQELEAHARALCFRTRMTGESAEHYRAAMKELEASLGSNAVLLIESARRRLRP